MRSDAQATGLAEQSRARGTGKLSNLVERVNLSFLTLSAGQSRYTQQVMCQRPWQMLQCSKTECDRKTSQASHIILLPRTLLSTTTLAFTLMNTSALNCRSFNHDRKMFRHPDGSMQAHLPPPNPYAEVWTADIRQSCYWLLPTNLHHMLAGCTLEMDNADKSLSR